ncbi:MAG: DUF2066 domain-containing protein [Xanthomonadales bacterium]|nr:DUF2066 domain-containing protein [Xanthomonadales bacterium]MDZ4115733.1 DUF2066 domain-containing protein [Xanthomonadaceae bacterium]MDZ4379363.1 DUF2066 domain-containing protein [Xanthomonadaceae bacterium]
MLRFLRFVFFVAVLATASLAAAQSPDLYEGETEVADQSEGERNAGLARILTGVIARLASYPSQAAAASIDGLTAVAPAMAQQYRYRQDVDTSSGVIAYRQILIARFDPAMVETMLEQAGIASWLGPRPEPQVWLAIDDGSGPRLVGAGQANAVSALSAQARARGLVLRFPDNPALSDLGLQAAWESDTDAADTLLGGAEAQVQLLGRLYRAGGGWMVQWTLRDAGAQIARITRPGANTSVLLAAGADLAADALARRYRDLAVSGPPGQYRVRIHGIASAEAYARLRAYLDTLPFVRAVQAMSAVDDELTVRLDLASGIEGFRAAIGQGAMLREDAEVGEIPSFGMIR